MIGLAFCAKKVTITGRLEKEETKVPGQLEKILESSCSELNRENVICIIWFLSV